MLLGVIRQRCEEDLDLGYLLQLVGGGAESQECMTAGIGNELGVHFQSVKTTHIFDFSSKTILCGPKVCSNKSELLSQI